MWYADIRTYVALFVWVCLSGECSLLLIGPWIELKHLKIISTFSSLISQSLHMWWRSQAEVLCCVILLLLCSFAIWQLLCHHCGRCFHHRNYFHNCNYFLNDNYFHHGNCFTMTTTFLIPSRLQLCLRSPVWQSWLVVSITFVLSGCALQQMSKHCVKPWHCLQAHCSQLTQKPS